MELSTKVKLVFAIFGVVLPLCLIAAHALTKDDIYFIPIFGSLILSGILLFFTESVTD